MTFGVIEEEEAANIKLMEDLKQFKLKTGMSGLDLFQQ